MAAKDGCVPRSAIFHGARHPTHKNSSPSGSSIRLPILLPVSIKIEDLFVAKISFVLNSAAEQNAGLAARTLFSPEEGSKLWISAARRYEPEFKRAGLQAERLETYQAAVRSLLQADGRKESL